MNKTTEQQKYYSGYFYAILAVIIWSGNFIAARYLKDMPPIEISFYRWLVTFLVLTPFCIKSLIKNIYLIKGMWIKMIIISVLGISIFNTLVYMSGKTSNATNMSLIATLSPIIIAIFERIFYKNKLTINQIAGLIAVIFGVIILITKGNLNILFTLKFSIGDIYMLFAVLLFSIYTLTLRLRPKLFPPTTFFYLMVTIGLIPLAILMCFKNGATYNINKETLSILIYVGIFPSTIAFILWSIAINKIGAIKASIIYDSIPFFTTLEAMILLKETLFMSQIVGGALILGGIIYASIKQKDKTLKK